jgi:hypothetical protein
MTELLWPKVETEKPYPISQVQPAARPRPDTPTQVVTEIPIGGNHHPRRSIGPNKQLPDGPVYWCLSCNRRVTNPNQPFCKRHKRQRDRYTRDLRETERKPVPVRRDDLRTLHHLARVLEERRARVNVAQDSVEFGRAWNSINETLMEFEQFVRANMPDGAVQLGRARPGSATASS